jgi:methylmalonyl-CoA mutase cobalamin-binding subunit
MLGFKYLKAGGRSLCGNFAFPVRELPQAVEHQGAMALCHRGFHISPSQAFAVKYAVEGASSVASVDLKDVEVRRYDKAVGRKIILHSVEEDFAHPTQLEPIDCAKLALCMVQQVIPLYPHPKVHQAIEAAENYLAHNSEDQAWASRAAGIAALDAAHKEERLTSSAILRSAWAAAWAAANTWIGWDATWAAATAGYWAAMAAASHYGAPESYLAEEKIWASFLEKGRELLFKGSHKGLPFLLSKAEDHLPAEDRKERKPPIIIGVVRPNNQENGIIFISALLQGAGLEVHTLGINTPAERFVSEAVRLGARVIAMGVYTDEGIRNIGQVVKLLKEKELDTKTLVGGQGITCFEAEKIGVDAYVENGHDAVDVALRLADL